MNTLLLDQTAWDLVLDGAGNIALASNPYSIAQDCASAVRTFLGECRYDTTLGLPYFESILGKLPPPNFVKQKMIDACLTIPEVQSVNIVFTEFSARALTGQIQITDINGNTSEAVF